VETMWALILLGIFWLVWCAMHSLLIEPEVVDRLQLRLPLLARYYRVLYNVVALSTVLPLFWYSGTIAGEPIIVWQGWFTVGRYFILAIAIFLFSSGAKRYDLQYFLGIKQLRSGERHVLLSADDGFRAEGIHAVTRHPWYLGSILFVWSILPQYSSGELVAVIVLTVYLVVGSWSEERKILRYYNADYRRYQQRVSMLFPWKWLKQCCKRLWK
jgi:protein-S-isoprenylcysteine O-methyltransferase Ste14